MTFVGNVVHPIQEARDMMGTSHMQQEMVKNTSSMTTIIRKAEERPGLRAGAEGNPPAWGDKEQAQRAQATSACMPRSPAGSAQMAASCCSGGSAPNSGSTLTPLGRPLPFSVSLRSSDTHDHAQLSKSFFMARMTHNWLC